MISVVASSYNNLSKLKLFLSCMMNQKFKDFEVIIADDGSSDGTVEYLERLKKTLNNSLDLNFVTQNDKGFRLARIRNKGVSLSKYDYILFIDSDCIVDDGFILICSEIIRKFDHHIIGGKRIRINKEQHKGINRKLIRSGFDKIKKLSNRKSEPGEYSDDFIGISDKILAVLGCNFLCPRIVLEQVNGFDEEFIGWGGEENDFCLRVSRIKKYPTVFCGSLIVYHLEHNEVEDRGGTALWGRKLADRSVTRNRGKKIQSIKDD
ncbi:glycosyltransferase [Candidatus Pacearchaeota archaeon]|nr:glycosyltransferase [Candidatus Pacearchaeota archaeon]